MSAALDIITRDIYDTQAAFEEVLTDRSINFKKEAGFAIQVLSQNDYALGLAIKNRQSVINAVTNVAAIGISLNPAKRQAYLVPRDGKICLDISYIGLVELAVASGSVSWVKAELVREADRFVLQGMDRPPVHDYSPFAKDRGPIVGVYCVAKTADGDYLTDTMSIDEVFAIRDRSSAWKAWVEKKKKCPWVTDEGEMIKKTIVKRASKMWPKTERLDKAVHHLNTDGEEGLYELSPAARQDEAANAAFFDRAAWIEKANSADSAEALREIWLAGVQLTQKCKDKPGYDAFKAVVTARGAVLNGRDGVTDVTPKKGGAA